MVKRASLRSLWLSAYAGSNPVLRRAFFILFCHNWFMRYLACFKPTDEITRMLSEESIVFPLSGVHCTIWQFNFWERDEAEVIRALSTLEGRVFTTKILEYARYDNDSNVFVLRKPRMLQTLHQEVIRALRGFDKNPSRLDERADRYGHDKYNPHITISNSPELPGLKNGYIGISMEIRGYNLLKKKEGIWMEVEGFKLM